MGWQDAPPVAPAAPAAPGGQPAWMSAPAASAAPAKPKRTPIAVPESTAEPSTHLGRIFHGVMDPVMGAGQIAAHMGMDKVNQAIDKLGIPGLPKAIPYDEAMANRSGQYQASRAAAGSTGFDWDRLAGNVGAAALPMGPALRAASIPGRMALGAGGGAASGALQPVESGDFGHEKRKQVLTGAAAGAAGPVVGQVAKQVVAPRINDAARYLAEKGVNLTPGMAFGKTAKSIEDRLTSIPLVGDVMKSGQRRAMESFNRVAANDALAPIGEKLPGSVKTGRALTSYVEDRLSQRYDRLLPKLKADLHSAVPSGSLLPTTPGGQVVQTFEGQIRDLQQMVRQAGFAPAKASELNRFIDTKVLGKFTPQGKADGKTIKTIQEELRLEINRLKQGGSDDRDMAAALKQVRAHFDDMIERVNPGQKAELDKINAGWSGFKRLQRAGAGILKDNEPFTPAGYSRAVRSLDRSKDKSAYGRRSAPGQTLSDAASQVMPSQYPDSGSIGRYLLDAGLLGGAQHFGAGAALGAHPLAAAGLGAGASLYTQPGMALLRQYLTPSQFREFMAQSANQGITATAPQIGMQMQR